MRLEPSNSFHATTLLASVAVFLIALELTVIAVALPALSISFPEANPAQLASIFTTYNWVTALMLLGFGLLADRYGRKRAFMVGLALFAVGSTGCGLAGSIDTLLAWRVVQAIGGAFMTPASLALILAATNQGNRGQALAIWGAMAGVAAALGPLLGALVIGSSSWRWIFLLPVPVVIVTLLASYQWLHESVRAQEEQLNLVAVLAGLASSRSFCIATLASISFVAGFTAWLVATPTFFVEIWGYTLSQAGFALAPAPLAMAICAKPAAKLADTFGTTRVNLAACALACLACVWWLLSLNNEPNYLLGFVPGALALGAAIGAGFPLLTAAAMKKVEPAHYAVAAAAHTTARQLAMGAGAALAGWAISRVPLGSTADLLIGFELTWGLCGSLFICTGLMLLGPPATLLSPKLTGSANS